MTQSLRLSLWSSFQRVFRPATAFVVFALALVEVPVFLLRRRELFANDLLYPFWHWSLGHTVAGIDYALSLIHI